MLKKINEAYEIAVEIHLVVIGSRRGDSPHEGNQLFLTMEDSIPKVEVPRGPIELDWENARRLLSIAFYAYSLTFQIPQR